MSQSFGETNKSRNIFFAIRECIVDILNPVENVTSLAEDKLQVLEYTEEFGVHLTSLTMDKTENLGIRQLAAVLLIKYIEVHWTRSCEKFKGPEVSEAAKLHIKSVLPCDLNDPDSKMRSSVAQAVARIAYWDWPQKWPELFNILSQCLAGDENSVHGSMKVLLEFTKDVNLEHLPTIAPIILSEVYRIFDTDTIYRSKTRAQAVEIFITFSHHIVLKYDDTKDLCNSVWLPAVSRFIERFIYSLSSEATDCFLRSQIIKAICYVMDRIPRKKIDPYMPQLFPLVWNLFRQVTQDYQKLVINGSFIGQEIYDLDGELFSYEKYSILFLEFITFAIMCRDSQIELIMPNLLTTLLILMKITKEQREAWIEDPDRFLEEDFMEKFNCITVRQKALELFILLCSVYKERSFIVLGPTLVQFIQASEYEKSAGDLNWWKGHEATMYALGSINEMLHNQHAKKAELNIPEFMTNASSHLCHQNMDFLVGRCLWLSGKFANSLPPQVMAQYLQALQENISVHKNSTVRILAIKSLICYCENMQAEKSELRTIFVNYIPAFYQGLIDISQNCKSSELCLSLKAIIDIIHINSTCNEVIERKVIPSILVTFSKFNSDPHVLDLVQELVGKLSSTTQYQDTLTSVFIPALVEIFNRGNEAVDRGLQAVALDILLSIVRNSKPPLNDLLLNVAFPQAVQCILKSDDHATQQSGGECLRAYLSVCPEEVCGFRNGDGLGYMIQVVSQLLDPNASEFAATFIGRLIISLIMKAGNLLGDKIDVILKSVLSKLQRAETLSVVMSLVIVFAHLFLTQMDAMINFLVTVPGPLGKPALDYVLAEWLYRHHLFYGKYERTVSILALCKLFEYIISSNDTRITNVKVRADPQKCYDMNPEPNAMDYTEISVILKIFKLLLWELAIAMENDANGIEVGDIAELDDSANWSEKDLEDSDTEDEEEQNDCMNEPEFQVNMLQHLKDFITTFTKSPCFPPFIEGLDTNEKEILRMIGIFL